MTDALAALRGLPQSHHANIGQTGCTVGADGSGYSVVLWGRGRRLGQFEQTDARGIAARVGLEVQ